MSFETVICMHVMCLLQYYMLIGPPKRGTFGSSYAIPAGDLLRFVLSAALHALHESLVGFSQGSADRLAVRRKMVQIQQWKDAS